MFSMERRTAFDRADIRGHVFKESYDTIFGGYTVDCTMNVYRAYRTSLPFVCSLFSLVLLE